MTTTTRDRIVAAAEQHSWTHTETIDNGPGCVIEMFERANPDNGTDIIEVSFCNGGRFYSGKRVNNVPADDGSAKGTLWNRIGRGEHAVYVGPSSPKGRVERIIAAFA